MNIQPLLDALELQEDAARALPDDLRAQIDDLQTRLREAEMHLEHPSITRKTVTGLTDRLPPSPPELPEHPDYPRILAVFNRATGPLRAKDVCEAIGHALLPKSVEGTRAKLKRLVKLGIPVTEESSGRKAAAIETRLGTAGVGASVGLVRHSTGVAAAGWRCLGARAGHARRLSAAVAK